MSILALILVVAFVAIAFGLQAHKRSQERAVGVDVYAVGDGAAHPLPDVTWQPRGTSMNHYDYTEGGYIDLTQYEEEGN